MNIVPLLVHQNNNISNINNILINELKQKTKCNILNNNEIKKLNNKFNIDILFESERAIICININYSDNKSTIVEFNNFVNSVKEVNKLIKNNKKCYAIYLSKVEPLQSCKAVFNKENINFEKTSNIKFITVYAGLSQQNIKKIIVSTKFKIPSDYTPYKFSLNPASSFLSPLKIGINSELSEQVILNPDEEYLNLLKRLQIKLHSFGVYYYDQDDSVIMCN